MQNDEQSKDSFGAIKNLSYIKEKIFTPELNKIIQRVEMKLDVRIHFLNLVIIGYNE